MSDFQFYEESHIYTLAGKKLPCVSELCRFLKREVYKDAPTWRMKEAAARGTAIHAATQSLDASGSAPVDEECAPYVRAYARFLQEHTAVWELTEHSLYHPTELYAGTIDRYGLLDGRRTLLDIKSTYKLEKPLCAASLNLYRKMLEAKGYTVERLAILHLKKNGTYKISYFPADDQLPRALLVLNNVLKPKERKKRHV